MTEVHTGKMIVHKTDKLVFKYAKLPTESASDDYLVSMVLPFETVPQFHSILQLAKLKGATLESTLLNRWRVDLFQAHGNDVIDEIRWMHEIDTVELIECDVLVPKK